MHSSKKQEIYAQLCIYATKMTISVYTICFVDLESSQFSLFTNSFTSISFFQCTIFHTNNVYSSLIPIYLSSRCQHQSLPKILLCHTIIIQKKKKDNRFASADLVLLPGCCDRIKAVNNCVGVNNQRKERKEQDNLQYDLKESVPAQKS